MLWSVSSVLSSLRDRNPFLGRFSRAHRVFFSAPVRPKKASCSLSLYKLSLSSQSKLQSKHFDLIRTSLNPKRQITNSLEPKQKRQTQNFSNFSQANKNSKRTISIAVPIDDSNPFRLPLNLDFLAVSSILKTPTCTAQFMLRCMHYFGSTAFAYNGATIAGSAGMHILGCTIVGTINAVGGGTIRDILTGNTPIFWARQPQFVFIGLVASACTFLLWPWLEENDLNWEKDSLPMIISDACGVASISIVGAQNGLQLGLNPYVCVMLGMVSSSFGGVVRDILCEQPPRILYNHSHVYASTALCGSGSYVALKYAGVSPKLRIGLAFTASMMSRYLAWRQDWRLIHWEWVERKKMGHHFQHNET